jgi:hypothetical protein
MRSIPLRKLFNDNFLARLVNQESDKEIEKVPSQEIPSPHYRSLREQSLLQISAMTARGAVELQS